VGDRGEVVEQPSTTMVSKSATPSPVRTPARRQRAGHARSTANASMTARCARRHQRDNAALTGAPSRTNHEGSGVSPSPAASARRPARGRERGGRRVGIAPRCGRSPDAAVRDRVHDGSPVVGDCTSSSRRLWQPDARDESLASRRLHSRVALDGCNVERLGELAQVAVGRREHHERTELRQRHLVLDSARDGPRRRPGPGREEDRRR